MAVGSIRCEPTARGPVWELAGPVSERAKLADAISSVITDLRQRNWIWRPPDQAGTFQASVYDIQVLGHW